MNPPTSPMRVDSDPEDEIIETIDAGFIPPPPTFDAPPIRTNQRKSSAALLTKVEKKPDEPAKPRRRTERKASVDIDIDILDASLDTSTPSPVTPISPIPIPLNPVQEPEQVPRAEPESVVEPAERTRTEMEPEESMLLVYPNSDPRAIIYPYPFHPLIQRYIIIEQFPYSNAGTEERLKQLGGLLGSLEERLEWGFLRIENAVLHERGRIEYALRDGREITVFTNVLPEAVARGDLPAALHDTLREVNHVFLHSSIGWQLIKPMKKLEGVWCTGAVKEELARLGCNVGARWKEIGGWEVGEEGYKELGC